MTNDAIALVKKKAGVTSHDVVDIARSKLEVKRIGHAGTLDPFATGLLILGVGRGTRILEYFKDLKKTYRTRMKLGLITDTYDITGTLAEERPVKDVSRDLVEDTLESFVGKYMQVPPAYSARKYHGERLYRLARQGKIMNLPPREVEIYSIDLHEFDASKNEVEFTASVSAGTYIRSLVMDIGYKLDTGATATFLARTEIGCFSLESAVPVEELTWSACMSLAASTSFIPAVTLHDSAVQSVLDGSQVSVPMISEVRNSFSKGQIIRLLDRNNNFIAIAKSDRTSKFTKNLMTKESRERVATLVKVLGV